MTPVKVRAPRVLSPRRPLSARRGIAEHEPLDHEPEFPTRTIVSVGVLAAVVLALFIVGLVALGDPTVVPTPSPGPAPVDLGMLP